MGGPDDKTRGIEKAQRATAHRTGEESPGAEWRRLQRLEESLEKLHRAKQRKEQLEEEIRRSRAGLESEGPVGGRKATLDDVVRRWAEYIVPEEQLPRGLERNFQITLPSGNRTTLHRVDQARGEFYLILPDTPSGIKKGKELLEHYKAFLDNQHPLTTARKWTGKLITYNKNQLVKAAHKVGDFVLDEISDLPPSWKQQSPRRRGTQARLRGSKGLAVAGQPRFDPTKRRHRRKGRIRGGKARGAPKGRGGSIPSLVFDLVGGWDIVDDLLVRLDKLIFGEEDAVGEKIEQLFPRVIAAWEEEMKSRTAEVLYAARKGQVFAEATLRIGVLAPRGLWADPELVYLDPSIDNMWNKKRSTSCNDEPFDSTKGTIDFSDGTAAKVSKKKSISRARVSERSEGSLSYERVGRKCSFFVPVEVEYFRDQLRLPHGSVNLTGEWWILYGEWRRNTEQYYRPWEFPPPEQSDRFGTIVRIDHSGLQTDEERLQISAWNANWNKGDIEPDRGGAVRVSNIEWNQHTFRLKFETTTEKTFFIYRFVMIESFVMVGKLIQYYQGTRDEKPRTVYLHKFR